MHDIDRVQLERGPEAETFETTGFEGEWTVRGLIALRRLPETAFLEIDAD